MHTFRYATVDGSVTRRNNNVSRICHGLKCIHAHEHLHTNTNKHTHIHEIQMHTHQHTSNTRQTHAKHTSNTRQTHVSHTSNTCQTHVKHTSNTRQTHVKQTQTHGKHKLTHVKQHRPTFRLTTVDGQTDMRRETQTSKERRKHAKRGADTQSSVTPACRHIHTSAK